MAASSLRLLVSLFVVVVFFSFPRSLAARSSLCPRSDLGFLDDVKSQCPVWIDRSLPLEVSGETLDRELGLAQRNTYTSVFFYASWCPFSSNYRPIFNVLSSMFPNIRHFTVEESSAMPSVFSRYGIHSFPAILLANKTSMVRYHGMKDLSSLVEFYKETTGLDPAAYFVVDKLSDSRNMRSRWSRDQPLRDIVTDEPFLALGVLFVILRMIIHSFPVVFSWMRAFWVSYAWHLNLWVIGGSSQLLERVLHAVDIKRLWSKIRLFNKTRNFRKGASNARVWASSLTSVSLGESSSSRVALSNS
ncbi:5'-adenylylsulfate reductase-like 5 [Typha angustifolia]|uniref:5'-adenylylsulfate reductase-like 5 n=1 Tax=Typha angustifolia TaxID=59011 RepID=UPI003C2DE399